MQQKSTLPCALCLRPMSLRRSHVIPEFFYDSIYDEKGHLYIKSASGEQPTERRQKGFWEWLLCGACESKFGEWERYAARVLREQVISKEQRIGVVHIVAGIDYRRFKLFQLSVLWRASVASNPVFAQVRLGPHEEKLRIRLLDGDAGESWEYPCAMFGLMVGDHFATDLMIEPVATKVKKHRTYLLIFGGFMWAYTVTNQRIENRFAITKDGGIVIGMHDAPDIPFVTDMMVRLIKREEPNRQIS